MSSQSYEVLTRIAESVNDLMTAAGISPVELTFGQPPNVNRFFRLSPYRREDSATHFDLNKYNKASEILTRFFGECVGDPDKSSQGEVMLKNLGSHKNEKRMARHYLSERGIDVYVLWPTKLERKTTVIPPPEDSNVLKVLRQHPVATVMAIKGPYILSGRLFNGSIYPPVNDFGEMHSLNQVNEGEGYQHLELNQLEAVFGNSIPRMEVTGQSF